MTRRIALVGTSTVSIEPVESALKASWPAARLFNVLDDALLGDLNAAGRVTDGLARRIGLLADYAIAAEAHAILFSCTAFGAAIETVQKRVAIPVLKPNQAMMERACEVGRKIGLLATTAVALPTIQAELEETARTRGAKLEIEARHVPGALDHILAGRAAEHDAAIVAHARALGPCDAILLGQFSMARAAAAVAQATGRPVLTSPGAAVERLKSILAG